MMKTLLSFAALALWAACPAMARDMIYSYTNSGEDLSLYGTGKTETYQAGIGIPAADNGLAGKTITQVRIPVVSGESLSAPTCWIATSLELVKGSSSYVFEPELTSPELTADEDGYITWTLDEPYEIPEATVYVGYEFKVLKLDDVSQYPLPLAEGNIDDNAFWLRTNRTFSQFTQLASTERKVMPVTVTLGGEFHVADIVLEFPSNQRVTAEEGSVTATLRNRGSKEVIMVRIHQILGEHNGSLVYAFHIPVNYDYPTEVKISALGASEPGTHSMTCNLTNIKPEGGGLYSNRSSEDVECRFSLLPFVPVKRPVLEEFTGTWCGNCPRGFVGLEKMAEFYPDDFIAMAYHDGDPMVMADGYYNPNIPGYPMSIMDRETLMDPYKGLEGTDFGIEATWLKYCEQDADAEIEVDTEWDGDIVRATSSTRWAIAPEGEYSICYVLCANGLKGESSMWAQTNYYAGQSTSMLYMDDFINGTNPQTGLTYNHVAVLCSSIDGLGEPGSMDTAQIEIGTPWLHTYEFDTAKAVNTVGDQIIQDPDQLYVVAMLIDNATGMVVNAAKHACGSKTGSIGSVAADAVQGDDAIYDLMGRKVMNPGPGIYIQGGKKVRY